jgi:hypothetical protein
MHLTDDEIGRYADEQTSNIHNSDFEAHLAGCENCKYRLLRALLREPFANLNGPAEAPAVGEERRRAPRLRFHERASLTRLNPLILERYKVDVLNVSRGGLKLHVSQPLERGAVVQIRLHAALVTGEVRYCARIGGEFQVGVRLLDAFFIDLDRLCNDQDRRMNSGHLKASVA